MADNSDIQVDRLQLNWIGDAETRDALNVTYQPLWSGILV